MQRIFTERAHLMCPNMNFGIIISIDAPFDKDLILKSAEMVSDAHPFLKSLLGQDDDGFYYKITDESQVQLIIKDIEISGVDDKILLGEYENLIKSEWNLRSEGMLKILSLRNKSKTILLFVFHHLLTDGRGAFMLAEEFAAAYKNGIKPEFVEESLISSKGDMPKNSTLPFVSKLLVKRANSQWKKENHTLSYDEYLKTANEFLRSDKVERSIQIQDADIYKEMTELCHEHYVSVNDYLMAKMYVEDKTDKIIIAYDLREKLSCYRSGAMGNYSTAFSIVYKDKCDDIWKVAKDVRALVKKASSNPKDLYLVLQCYAELNGDLLDATFVSSKCGYESKAANFIGTMFFGFGESKGHSITNLGKFDSDNIKDAVFLPPASPATRKTMGVVSVNGRMFTSLSVRNQIN